MTDSSTDIYASPKADADGLLTLAVLPLRGAVLYPGTLTALVLNTTQALGALEAAREARHTLLGIAQRDALRIHLAPGDLYDIGTELTPLRVQRLPDDARHVLAQGLRRMQVLDVVQEKPHLVVRARLLADSEPTPETRPMMQAVLNLFKRATDMNPGGVPDDVQMLVVNTSDPARLADLVASTLSLALEERQRVLETLDVTARLRHVALLLGKELNMLELKDEINSQVQQEMDRSQREVYLREQMRVIQTELGEQDFFQQEVDDVRAQIMQAKLPGEIHDKAMRELSRLLIMPPMSPEVGIIRTYIDWLTGLPWHRESKDNLDIAHAQRVLEAEHHGLDKVKDRVLEHIAVRKLAHSAMKSPILCFVGPPGVGKTSLGKTIARALGREFVRVSLGGVRDEAEIRGHRRTYIGALPGRIIQTMRRAGTVNPVFMLDEIDKLGMDFRGDPAAALLEVLDMEQNNAFSDHYLDVPYDLSKVLFITTANDLYPLPDALLDRLETIEFLGYTEEEKTTIARRFLIPRQLTAHGLEGRGLQFEPRALQSMIREYTYEAGVRNLERTVATVCRKIARQVAENKPHVQRVTARRLSDFLGPPEFIFERHKNEDAEGVALGMSWTAAGGDVMTIEVSVLAGKGTLLLTGQLGDVMQESAQTALSYTRSRAADFDIPAEDFENNDVHVHVPEGAVPKEGPSAGITLATAIISAFTERCVRGGYALTGEITLRGKVLPVGGIKEKVLAARRAQIKNVILPKYNEKDLVDVPKDALQDLNVHFVENMQQVLDLVLMEPPPEGRRRDQQKDTSEPEKDDEGERG